MFEFGSLLMQTDVVSSAEGLIVAISTLITAVGGMIVYIMNKKAAISKKDLSPMEQQIVQIAKVSMASMQKATENIGENRASLQALYTAATTPEQKAFVEREIVPKINQSTERLDKANQQVAAFNNAIIALLGPAADVNSDTSLPRESSDISTALRSIVAMPSSS